MMANAEDRPHFTAQEYLSYLCEQQAEDWTAFGIEENVVISYIGMPRLGPEFRPPRLRISSHHFFHRPGLTWLEGPVGSPSAATILEELVPGGARRVLILGYAGSLNPHFTLGNVVIVPQALSDEGTSRHYGGTGWGEASTVLTQRLQQANPTLPEGSLWTTDTAYRETAGKIARFRAAGCDLVDMETSSYFHVGAHLGIAVTAVMVVSDELFHPWTPGFGSPSVKAGAERVFNMVGAVLP